MTNPNDQPEQPPQPPPDEQAVPPPQPPRIAPDWITKGGDPKALERREEERS